MLGPSPRYWPVFGLVARPLGSWWKLLLIGPGSARPTSMLSRRFRTRLRPRPNEPSLYDDVLAFLSRRGFKIPAEVLRRNPSKTYASDPEVEKVWAAAYETDPAVKMLGDAMADIAEEFTTWKYRHLMATRRTIGNRSAYFGTPAVSWLLPTLEEIPFPELFSARTIIGDRPPVCPHVKS